MIRTSYTQTIHLRALTPLFIGAGENATLSPYTDFVQERDQLLYIDHSKLESIWAQDPQLVDEFVHGIRSKMNNTRSGFELKTFIVNRLGIEPKDLAYKSVPISGGKLGQVHIQRHIANAGRQPYIPGSTIKGAMRTAIMFNWLEETPEGKEVVKKVAREIERLWATNEQKLAQAERYFQSSNYYDNNAGKQLTREIREATKRSLANLTEEALFGKLQGNEDDGFVGPEMRFLSISDTAVFDSNDIEVTHIERYKLRAASHGSRTEYQRTSQNADRVSPQWRETIRSGSSTTFALTLAPPFKQPILQFLNNNGLDELLQRLNSFARASLEYELDRLDEIKNASLDDLYNSYADFEDQSNLSMMRLGGGKTYFDNSIGLALFKYDSDVFDHFRRLLGLGRNPKSKRFSNGKFPTTRTFISHDSNPSVALGWTSLSIE